MTDEKNHPAEGPFSVAMASSIAVAPSHPTDLSDTAAKRLRAAPDEDWYPTAADGTLSASWHRLRDGTYRVCVWGDDDFGLERDGFDRVGAIAMWESLPDPVSKQWLLDRGFVNA